MDTDDLSEEAYEAVIVTPEKFHHDLAMQFGLQAEGCLDEDEYLERCKQLILNLKQMEEDELGDIFFDNVPTVSDLGNALESILGKIDSVRRIPLRKRHFTTS